MPKPANLHTLVFHSLEEQIAVIDQDGNIVDVNQAWEHFGAENDLHEEYRCLGNNYLKTLADSVASGDSFAAEALTGISNVINGTQTIFYFEYPCHSPNQKRWFTMRVAPLHSDQTTSLFVISHHNITQRKLAEEQIEKLAMNDPLTELANRRAFFRFLTQEMRVSIRNQTPIALLLLDIDYFKTINDQFGHLAGDQCLTKVGQALNAHARRPEDLAARIGGDEFALALGNTELAVALKIAEAVLQEINELEMNFEATIQLTASIGVFSVIPNKQQNEFFLFNETDKALYQAKAAGRNQVGHLNTIGQAS